MTDSEVIQKYVDIVPFLAAAFGPSCEIVVHDLSVPEQPLVAICNGISKREIGDPITDYAKTIIDQGLYDMTSDYVVNYRSLIKNKEFLSSTYFIKNDGRIVGLLSINKDTTAVQHLNASLHTLLEQFNLETVKENRFVANLEKPAISMIRGHIADVIAGSGVDPAHMSMQEKVDVVHRLSEDGVLLTKGGVAEIAEQLKISVPTVYRYLKKDTTKQ